MVTGGDSSGRPTRSRSSSRDSRRSRRNAWTRFARTWQAGSRHRASPSRQADVTRRGWGLISLARIALLLLARRPVAGVYADWTWYAAMGALPLYRSKLTHETVLLGGTALAGFILAFANLYAVRSSIVWLVLPRRLGNIQPCAAGSG